MILRLKHLIKSRSPSLYSSLSAHHSHFLKLEQLVRYYTVPPQVRRKLKRIARSSKPILVGPWVSEIGFELLYWIPFLEWFKGHFGLSSDRFVVISRGGASQWYETICDRYVDIFDYLPPSEFRAKNQERIEWFGAQKHVGLSKLDREVLNLVSGSLGAEDFELLHPSLMYRLFDFYWYGPDSIGLVEKYTAYKQWPGPSPDDLTHLLPEEYVAVKFYFSACFPDTMENRSFVYEVLRNLSAASHVVVLDTGLQIDDHPDLGGEEGERIHSISHLVTPANNLDVQTRVVANATAFVGTYGGFAYLAPILGVPAIAFHSNGSFLPVHLEMARRAFSGFKNSSLVLLDVKDYDHLGLVAPHPRRRVPDVSVAER